MYELRWYYLQIPEILRNGGQESNTYKCTLKLLMTVLLF